MTSPLDNYYPSMIRLLDVQAIGPYLVKQGILSSHEYYDNFAGPLQKGETSNYKLSLKLANKCLKKPEEFHEALEESLSSMAHANHQELLELLPDQITPQRRNHGLPLNVSSASLNSPSNFADKERPAGSTGLLRSHRNSIGYLERSHSQNTSPQTSPIASPKWQRSGSFISTLSQSITANGDQKEKRSESELYQQEQKSFQAETNGKMQAECKEFRDQLKEFDHLKERNDLLKEILDKTKDENQQLNQQIINVKIELGTFREKLSAKAESEVLKVTKTKLEESIQTLQEKHDNLNAQLESATVRLESKLEKIDDGETLNREIQKQVNELRMEQSKHQRWIEADQQKCHQLECQLSEKDMKISNLEGKMEVISKQLQELANANEKEVMKHFARKTINFSNSMASAAYTYKTDCSKQDLIEIIEVHVKQIETLHQKIYNYKKEIYKLQRKLKCVM